MENSSFWYNNTMRLRKFLICIGLWISILPYIGLSIIAENILFSMTGFLLIVSSFYIAAIEDRHKHKRIIREENIEGVSQKVDDLLKQITPQKKKVQTRIKKADKKDTINFSDSKYEDSKSIKKKFLIEKTNESSERSGFDFDSEMEDDTRPRIKKAVSDVKIKLDSVDDIVS